MSAQQLCVCGSLSDLAHVPMGGDGLDEKFLATVSEINSYGQPKWWLWLGKCSTCKQDWLVAQDERIFDEYFLKKLTFEQAHEITHSNQWPQEFLTYENVLRLGGTMSTHCRFLERTSPSLVWTAEELLTERPNITTSEIAALLGIDIKRANDVMRSIGKDGNGRFKISLGPRRIWSWLWS